MADEQVIYHQDTVMQASNPDAWKGSRHEGPAI
jgi:hypothetical protein